MRAALVAALCLLASCDTVFGLERDTAPGDAGGDALDAGDGIVVYFRVAQPVVSGDQRVVEARIQHQSDERVPWQLTSTGGSLGSMSGTVALDAKGVGDINVPWTAPGAAQQVTFTLAVLGVTRTLVVDVHAITSWGHDLMTGSSLMVAANTATGIAVDITRPGTLTALGGWTASASSNNMRFALYTESGGRPAMKLAETPVKPVIAQRNVVSVTTPAGLTAGRYWLMVLTDGPVTFQAIGGTGYVYAATLFSGGFPAIYASNQFTATGGTEPNLFAMFTE